MEAINQTLAVLEESTGLSSFVILALIGATMFAVVSFASSFAANSSVEVGEQIQGVKSGSKVARTNLLMVGAAGSGKTKLFYKLVANDHQQATVSSAEPNTYTQGIKMPSELTKYLPLVDLPGHYNFRQKMRDEHLQSAKAVIFVLDARDKEKMQDSAEILYEVINDIDVTMSGVPILIVCNKMDLTFARRAVQIERELQIEIEQIRKVKKASREQE